MYKLVVTERAEAEYEEAYWFYEERQSGLGSGFEQEVDRCVKVIRSNPLLFQRKHKKFREALLKRFPYFIVYEIILKAIVIHSFFHTSRNPRKKYKGGHTSSSLLNEPVAVYRKIK